jgi:fructosamine-3-kinase
LNISNQIEHALGQRPLNVQPLSGGCVGEVYGLVQPDGQKLVAKVGGADANLAIEGWMLRTLRERSALPVPAVLYESDTLLVMERLEADGGLSDSAERHAAELIAALHGISAERFGLERDTLIGGLHQPNSPSGQWLPFFRDQRLRHMAGEAVRIGRMPASIQRRIDALCEQLDRWIGETSVPSLIHGDLWSGNVLAARGRITGFIDPAIYYADPEIELAFTTLFGTFGQVFFRRYGELRPLRPGFFEERRDLYNLYPLLVHVRLFGGGYVHQVEATLRRYGC